VKQSLAWLLVLASAPLFAREPKYEKPQVEVPQNWQAPAPWRDAAPKDGVAKGAWWTLFNDPVLNSLENQLTETNADDVKAKMLADKYDIFAGGASGLKDNKGATVIAAGKAMKQTDIELEKMNYLVEGVIGSA